MSLLKELADPDKLTKAFLRIRLGKDPREYIRLSKEWPTVAPQLCEQLRMGTYIFPPYEGWKLTRKKYSMQNGTVLAEPKPRDLVRMPLVDKVVQRALYELIKDQLREKTVTRIRAGITGSVLDCLPTITEKRSAGLWCFESDIKDFYPTIDRTKLRRHLVHHLEGDDSLCTLIEQFVETLPGGDESSPATHGIGVVQGAVLSPLLANVYLYPFDQFLEKRWPNSIRYMDDFVIFTTCEKEAFEASKLCLDFLKDELGLTAYEIGDPKEKAHVRSPQEEIGFLGLRFMPDATVEPALWIQRKYEDSVKDICCKEKPVARVLRELDNYLSGFWGYYGHDTLKLSRRKKADMDRMALAEIGKYLRRKGLLKGPLQNFIQPSAKHPLGLRLGSCTRPEEASEELPFDLDVDEWEP